MKVNLNDTIKVKLTAYGVKVHFDHYFDIFQRYMQGKMQPQDCMPKVDDEGYTQYQLWQFIDIFGNYIYMGSQNVIEPLDIIVCD